MEKDELKLACPKDFFNEWTMQHIHLDECLSTQSSFKQFWEQRAVGENNLLVTCERQTAGIGRRGASWLSGEHCLTMSCSLKAHPKITLTPLALGLKIVEFFASKNIEIKLKWPNDLLTVEGAKVAGLLCQTLEDNYVLLGLGINLFLSENEMKLVASDYPVAHLNLKVDKQNLARELYQSLQSISDFSVHKWNQACLHLNKEVRIIDGDSIQSGIFVGIDEDGCALLKKSDTTTKVLSGSLRFF